VGQLFLNRAGEPISPNSFDVLATWVQALHGQGKITNALFSLLSLYKSDAALIVRFVEGNWQPRKVAVVNQKSDKSIACGHSSFTEIMLGENLGVSKTGTLWLWSDLIEDSDAVESLHIQQRILGSGLSDVGLIGLENSPGHYDYLELHFKSNLGKDDKNHLSLLAATLSKTWEQRLPGTVQKLLAQSRVQKTLDHLGLPSKPILDINNPYELSRCEYRICTMVKEGMLVKDIATGLSIREVTVRSHLCSIYAKTDTSGQIELLHRLTIGTASVPPEIIGQPNRKIS